MLRKLFLQQELLAIQNPVCFVQKTFVIIAKHQNINIIVPRDKATVAHRAEHCTGEKNIGYIKLLAHAIELAQNNYERALVVLKASHI